MVVTALSCIERFLGFLYRIYLSRTIGSEGVGIYQIALSILGLFMTISTAGIPITISRMITKHKSNNSPQLINSTVTCGFALSLLISVPIFCLIFFFSDTFSFIFSDERCMAVLLVMIPGLIFTCIYSVIRGYFWGNTDFLTYSIIELAEELVMLIVGIILINNMTSMLNGTIRAGVAVLISYIFSFTFAFTMFSLRGGRIAKLNGQFKLLTYSSLPITAMRTTNAFINSLIAIILPMQLIKTGIDSSMAMSQFGRMFGMAIPLIFIPATLIGSLALVLVPELSKNFYDKKFITLRRNIVKCLKFSIFIACMIIPTFIILGKELGIFLYHDATAGIYISVCTVIMLPMSVNIISTSMLNSLNFEKKSLIFYLIGGGFMLLSIYFLPAVCGIYSLAIGMFLNFSVSAILNLSLLNKCNSGLLQYKKYLMLAIIFTFVTALFGYYVKNLISLQLSGLSVIITVFIVQVPFNLMLYFIFNMLDIKSIIKIIKK